MDKTKTRCCIHSRCGNTVCTNRSIWIFVCRSAVPAGSVWTLFGARVGLVLRCTHAKRSTHSPLFSLDSFCWTQLEEALKQSAKPKRGDDAVEVRGRCAHMLSGQKVRMGGWREKRQERYVSADAKRSVASLFVFSRSANIFPVLFFQQCVVQWQSFLLSFLLPIQSGMPTPLSGQLNLHIVCNTAIEQLERCIHGGRRTSKTRRCGDRVGRMVHAANEQTRRARCLMEMETDGWAGMCRGGAAKVW